MKALRAAVVVAAGLAVSAGWAQQSVDIVIAGRIVARLRDKGAYASLADRAAKADQRIADVISFEDTQHPQVSVRQVDGTWHVFVGKRDLLGVFAGDARGQGIDAKTLAVRWMKNIQVALPFATPLSKLPPPKPTPAARTTPPGGVPSVPQYTYRTPGATGPKPESPAPGGEPVTEMVTPTPGASTTAAGETAPSPAVTSQPPEPKTTPRSVALLLLLDALNSARLLSESEYLAVRDRMASNVLENLEPYMRLARAEGEASGTHQPSRPIEIIPPAPRGPSKPVVVGPSTGPRPPTGVTPARPTGPGIPVVPTGPSVTSKPSVAGASTARVPQKQRIGRKFRAAQGPYDQLKATGAAGVTEVGALLKAARDAFAAGDFDAAEAAVDQALQAMGVPIPQ